MPHKTFTNIFQTLPTSLNQFQLNPTSSNLYKPYQTWDSLIRRYLAKNGVYLITRISRPTYFLTSGLYLFLHLLPLLIASLILAQWGPEFDFWYVSFRISYLQGGNLIKLLPQCHLPHFVNFILISSMTYFTLPLILTSHNLSY